MGLFKGLQALNLPAFISLSTSSLEQPRPSTVATAAAKRFENKKVFCLAIRNGQLFFLSVVFLYRPEPPATFTLPVCGCLATLCATLNRTAISRKVIPVSLILKICHFWPPEVRFRVTLSTHANTFKKITQRRRVGRSCC